METTSDVVERARELVLKHLGADHPVSHEYDLKPIAEVILALAERLETLAHGQKPLAPEPQCGPTYEVGGNFTHHNGSRCGESNHRSTGDRAWCSYCTEWCYPDEGCIGCRYPNGLL